MIERKRARVLLYDEPLPVPPPSLLPVRSSRSLAELTVIEKRFCDLWMTHYNERLITETAMQAGYSIPDRAYLTGRRLLRDPRCQQYIASVQAERLRRTRFDGDAFLAQELLLATASVTELIEVWVPPCRRCWGTNYGYQRTHAEFEDSFEAYVRLPEKRPRRASAYLDLGYGEVLVYDEGGAKVPFDQMGGDGYDPEQPPNPACPNCRGRGNEHPEHGTRPYVKLKPTHLLSDAGKALFAGVSRTTRGVEQLVRNQDAARHRLMAMLGKFLELRAAGQMPNASSLSVGIGVAGSVADLLTDDPSSMSDVELDTLLEQYGVRVGAFGQGEGGPAPEGEAAPPGRVA